MLKGTQVLFGEDAKLYREITENLMKNAAQSGFRPVILPSIWESQEFIEKAGPDILDKMYVFKDKGGRDCCLIPEATAIIQRLYNNSWNMSVAKPIKVYYLQKCYRYDRPQAGRYREFTQFGVEILGGKKPDDYNEIIDLAQNMLPRKDGFEFKPSVKRGLTYYIEDGFEIEYDGLGAQKQILGGGRYKEGIGFAIGVERAILCAKGKKP